MRVFQLGPSPAKQFVPTIPCRCLSGLEIGLEPHDRLDARKRDVHVPHPVVVELDG